MSGLPFKAEPMGGAGLRTAPKGKLPYIDNDGTIIADSTFIRFHLEQKHGIDFDKAITPEQRAAGWAFEKMCEEHPYWAIVDSRWMVAANFDKGPRHFFDGAPALIRPLIIAMVHRRTQRTMHGQGMGRHTRSDIETLAARDLDAIAAQLGDKPFLFGAEPHAADASVFASVSSTLCPLFEIPIRSRAETHANLVAYRDHGMARWFPELAA